MRRNNYSELRPHIGDDEELLWIGHPKTGIVFSKGDIFFKINKYKNTFRCRIFRKT